MFLVTCFLYFCSYPNHYYVSLYDARADLKNRLELEGISHVVSFPDVSGGGRGGGGGGGGGAYAPGPVAGRVGGPSGCI